MLQPLQRRFDRLEKTRTDFLRRVQSLHPEQRAFSPNDRSWSLLQVIEHLIISEEQTIRIVEKQLANPKLPNRGRWHAPIRMATMKLVMRLPLKFKIPTDRVAPSPSPDFAQLKSRWDTVRQQMQRTLKSVQEPQLHLPVFRHPFFGHMDVGQVVLFLQEHFDHHMQQARRIFKAGRFESA
ncbi:MAG: DinB family protein [candidate division KSB1 bacterium]|nr:DinB family protein [candidate division KSB1 bacterium]MDQ7066168.1 DinB family protein [candidate division KSB1 bacterium]